MPFKIDKRIEIRTNRRVIELLHEVAEGEGIAIDFYDDCGIINTTVELSVESIHTLKYDGGTTKLITGA